VEQNVHEVVARQSFRKLKNGVKRTLAKRELYEKADDVGCTFMLVVFSFVEDGSFNFSYVLVMESRLHTGHIETMSPCDPEFVPVVTVMRPMQKSGGSTDHSHIVNDRRFLPVVLPRR